MHSLIPACPSNEHWNGIATTSSGRVFVYFNRTLNDNRTRIGEILLHDRISPYPSLEWNLISTERELLYSFVSIQAAQVSEEGSLWILDRGCHTEGCMVKDSAKLIEINLDENEVNSIIPLNELLYENSRIKDMRISKEHLYLSDVGEPDLIVINIERGTGFRVNDKRSGDEKPVVLKAIEVESVIDEHLSGGGQLELSEDGNFLFYLDASGILKKYQTEMLFERPEEAEEHFNNGKFFSQAPDGALSRDGKGNLFLVDCGNSRILKFDHDGISTTFMEDKLLFNADGLWIDHDNFLWVTIGKRSNEDGEDEGKQVKRFPVYLLKIPS